MNNPVETYITMAEVLVLDTCDNVGLQQDQEDMNIKAPPKRPHLMLYLEIRRCSMIWLSNMPRKRSADDVSNSTIPVSHISAVGNIRPWVKFGRG